MNQVSLNFKNEFNGELKTQRTSISIGSGENTISPYELLAGALGSCLYSTFLDIVKKMRLDFDSCSLNVEIEKRTEVPTTAKLVVVKALLKGANIEKKDHYTRAFTLATEYCSIYSTLSHVAEMKWLLEFDN